MNNVFKCPIIFGSWLVTECSKKKKTKKKTHKNEDTIYGKFVNLVQLCFILV